jgi:Ca2+-binding RTX toxin-like protein
MVGLWSTLPASAALAGHGGSWHVVERVSVASDGSQASGRSIYPAVSGDGRIVAFDSDADNLVPGDSISTGDVFVHDRATGRTELVSVARDGSQASGGSFYSAVSGDGRTVAFYSRARLVPGDSNRRSDVFVAKRKVSSRPGCTVNGSAGDGVLIGTAGDDVLCGRGGDDRLLRRGGDDRLRGGRGADRLRGGRRQDRLYGGRGQDQLYGGPDPDRLRGGPGDDRLRGGPGDDRLRERPG